MAILFSAPFPIAVVSSLSTKITPSAHLPSCTHAASRPSNSGRSSALQSLGTNCVKLVIQSPSIVCFISCVRGTEYMLLAAILKLLSPRFPPNITLACDVGVLDADESVSAGVSELDDQVECGEPADVDSTDDAGGGDGDRCASLGVGVAFSKASA